MEKIDEKILFQGNWLSLKNSRYRDQHGREFSWEHVVRERGSHAVVMLATLQPSRRVILIRQFRPGANARVIGLPAGLVEDNCSAEENALRELREETGYWGTVRSISPVLSSFPALSDATVQLFEIEVDENLPENQKPTQTLEPGEDISVILLPRAEILPFLEAEAKAGTRVVSGLWYLFKDC